MIGNTPFSGLTGPGDGTVWVAANTTISWSSNAVQTVHRGFYICASASAKPTMPMVVATNLTDVEKPYNVLNLGGVEKGRLWCNSAPIVNSTSGSLSQLGRDGYEHLCVCAAVVFYLCMDDGSVIGVSLCFACLHVTLVYL